LFSLLRAIRFKQIWWLLLFRFLVRGIIATEVIMANETMFDSMNQGSKQVDTMSRMNAVDVAASRQNESLRSYAKESGAAGGLDEGSEMSDTNLGPYNVGITNMSDADVGVDGVAKSGGFIQSGLANESDDLDIPDTITGRFDVIGHGSSMEMKPGRPMNKKSFAIVRDNEQDKDFTVEGGEQIPGLGRVRKITHGGASGDGIEILSEPGRGPGDFVLPFGGRNDDDLLMGMTDAGPGMGVMSPRADFSDMDIGDMGSMAADMMTGGRGAFGGRVGPGVVSEYSPAERAVLGTPLANDYLAGKELLRQDSGESGESSEAEIDAALIGEMGFDAMDPNIAPEVGMGLRKLSENPNLATRPVRYSKSTMVDDQRAHIFDIGNGRPGEVFIYFPDEMDGRVGSTAEIGRMV
jgi:hypothetical protein